MNRVNKYLIFVAYAGFIAIAISGGALNITWLYIQDDFTLRLSDIGVLLIFPSMARLLISFYSGRLIKRLGVGNYLLMGSVLATSGMIGFATASSWTVLVIVAMIMGFGNALLSSGLNIFVASNYASSRMNWLHASFGFGATIGPLLITVIVLDMGLSWRVGYLVMATLIVMLGFLVILTRHDWHLPTSTPLEKSKLMQAKGVFLSPIVWLGKSVV